VPGDQRIAVIGGARNRTEAVYAAAKLGLKLT
jgi:hypothetical protein